MSEWRVYVDDVTGRAYWVDHATGCTGWAADDAPLSSYSPGHGSHVPCPAAGPGHLTDEGAIAGEDDDLVKADIVFTFYDTDGDGVWSEDEVRGPSGVMPGLPHNEWITRCDVMQLDPSRGWPRNDVIAMYLTEPSRASLHGDLARVVLLRRQRLASVVSPDAHKDADIHCLDDGRELIPDPLPPVDAMNPAPISARIPPVRRRRAKHSAPPDGGGGGGAAHPVPGGGGGGGGGGVAGVGQPRYGVAGSFTSTEQALIRYYDGLLFDSYLKQEQLKFLANQALQHSRDVSETMQRSMKEGGGGGGDEERPSQTPAARKLPQPSPPQHPMSVGALPRQSSLKKKPPPRERPRPLPPHAARRDSTSSSSGTPVPFHCTPRGTLGVDNGRSPTHVVRSPASPPRDASYSPTHTGDSDTLPGGTASLYEPSRRTYAAQRYGDAPPPRPRPNLQIQVPRDEMDMSMREQR